MTQLFDRRCVLQVGYAPTSGKYTLDVPNALRIEGLRVVFSVKRDDQPQPNTAEITIYNLSADSRRLLEGKGQRVVLHAGYRDEVAYIFSGDARRVHSEKQGTDWVTKVEAGDGERAFMFARVKESYSPGTKRSDVVKRTMQALAPDVGSSLVKADEIPGEFSKGYAQHARASDELTSLLKPLGWRWSLQDGRLELLRPGESLTEEAPVITPDSGLVGSPTWESPLHLKRPARLRVRSLLIGRLRPGQRFRVESRDFKGELRARAVHHVGDTDGGEWFTDVEGSLQ